MLDSVMNRLLIDQFLAGKINQLEKALTISSIRFIRSETLFLQEYHKALVHLQTFTSL